jgi:predicted nucleotidyltransferase
VKKLLRIFKQISRELSSISEIRLVILYGSYARGDFGPKSDLDLFILMAKGNAVEKIHNAIIRIEEKIGKNIQPTIRTGEEFRKTDSGLIQNLLREGKILFLRDIYEISAVTLLKQKPFIIYSFKINSLSQKNKAKFNREFYARTKKQYEYKGLLQELGGEKLASGCILIPFRAKNEMERIFKKYKIKYEAKNIWA